MYSVPEIYLFRFPIQHCFPFHGNALDELLELDFELLLELLLLDELLELLLELELKDEELLLELEELDELLLELEELEEELLLEEDELEEELLEELEDELLLELDDELSLLLEDDEELDEDFTSYCKTNFGLIVPVISGFLGILNFINNFLAVFVGIFPKER